jgi:hypothetical protein
MTNHQFKAGRVQAPLTQTQAAPHLGLSQPYLSRLLGRRAPRSAGRPCEVQVS